MAEIVMTFTWHGKPERELSREELAEAVNYLAAENKRLARDLRDIRLLSNMRGRAGSYG